MLVCLFECLFVCLNACLFAFFCLFVFFLFVWLFVCLLHQCTHGHYSYYIYIVSLSPCRPLVTYPLMPNITIFDLSFSPVMGDHGQTSSLCVAHHTAIYKPFKSSLL